MQKKRNTPKHLIIRDAKRQGLRIGYKLLGTFESEKEAICAEQDFIRRYGRLDRASGVLVNLSDGGEGYVEKYFSERWKTDENGIRLVEATAVPTDEDLVAPRFSSHNDLITETNAAGQVLIIGKRKPAEWSGPEMPLIAQWQGHGLTVQVFFAGSEKHDIQTWISMPWRDELNVPIAVRFRVFDGCRRILEDRTAFFLECFGRELCSPRASEPSPERLVAEGLLVAAILRRLADLGKEIESASPENRVRPRSAVTIRQNGPWRGRNRRSVGFPRPGLFRFDLDYGTRTFTKRLQAWVKYNSDSLRLIAVEIETKSKAPCEGG